MCPASSRRRIERPYDVDIYRVALTPARLDVKASAADGLLDPVVRLRSCDTALSTTHDDDCLLGASRRRTRRIADVSVSVAVLNQRRHIMVSAWQSGLQPCRRWIG